MNQDKFETNRMAIGNRIRELRKAQRDQNGKPMNQETFAEFVGLSDGITGNSAQYLISGLENGKKVPTTDQLIALSTKCNVSTDWILTGKKPEYSAKPENTESHLSDVLRAIFLLVDNTSFSFNVEEGKASIELSVSLDDINEADPTFLHLPFLLDHDENMKQYYSHFPKLYLFYEMQHLKKLQDLSISDSSGMISNVYTDWKKTRLEETANYRSDGSLIDNKGPRCNDLERIKSSLEKLRGFGSSGNSITLKTVQDFYSSLS